MGDSQPLNTPTPTSQGNDLEKIVERLEKVSDKISTQIRTLGLGILAFTWGLLAGQSPATANLGPASRWQLLLVGALSILGLSLDLLQYVFGYRVADDLRKKIEAEGGKGEYNYGSLLYRAQILCFYAKQFVMVLAAGWLLVAVVSCLVIN